VVDGFRATAKSTRHRSFDAATVVDINHKSSRPSDSMDSMDQEVVVVVVVSCLRNTPDRLRRRRRSDNRIQQDSKAEVVVVVTVVRVTATNLDGCCNRHRSF